MNAIVWNIIAWDTEQLHVRLRFLAKDRVDIPVQAMTLSGNWTLRRKD
jgi:hypothetical protein